jgi:hypothetical protein
MQVRVDSLSKMLSNVDEYKKKLTFIENIIQNDSSVNNQQKILNIVSDFCSKYELILKDFPQPIVYTEKKYIVETSIFEVEGEFHKLLKLVYELEQVNIVGKIMSVEYEIKRNYKTKSFALSATIYLLNIKKIKKHEKDK